MSSSLDLDSDHPNKNIQRLRDQVVQLEHSRNRFKTLLETTGDWIWEVDSECVYTYCSPQVVNLLGYEPEELIGRTLFELMPSGKAVRSKRRFQTLSESCKPIVRLENHVYHKDGHLVILETSAVPFFDGQNRLAGYRGIDREITQRFQPEKDLQKSLQSEKNTSILLEAVLDAIPDVIGVQDGNYRIIRYNEAGYRFLKISPEDAIGKKCFQLIGREGRCEICATSEAIATGKPAQVEKFFPELGKWIDARSYPVLDDEGRVTQIVEHLRDITPLRKAAEERRQLESQVQHAQKLESLGLLAGGIAHDFNNLLTSILGNADLAASEISSGSQIHIYLEDIVLAARRAADLCREMLAYSGKGRFIIQKINLNEVVSEMSKMLEVTLSKKASIQYQLSEKKPVIEADATQIRQVFMNLITNAAEAIGEVEGLVKVTTGVRSFESQYLNKTILGENVEPGLYAFIEVSDTGCGMDTETVSKLFDPFFSTKFTGRGLGMAAVLGIVRGHHGTIRVQSKPDRGTTIRILLPASLNHTLDEEISYKTGNSELQGSGTILVVDDEETVRTLAKRMLNKLGFKVRICKDGLEALRVFRENQEEISCVLLDLTMPRLDGAETLRELYRLNPDLNVILSSGYDEQEVTQRFAGKGPAGFLQKPYQLSVLESELKRILNKSS